MTMPKNLLRWTAAGLLVAAVANSSNAQTFLRTYGSDEADSTSAVVETEDGGAIMLVSYINGRVVRVDRAGNPVWIRYLRDGDASTKERLMDLALTADGDILVCGEVEREAWIARLSGDTGEVLWEARPKQGGSLPAEAHSTAGR